MIISVTGGAGFIGRPLALRHLALGHEVRILSRKNKIDPRARLYLGDLSQTDVLRQFVDGAHILYHCAGEVRNESHMHAVHVAGTQCLIKAASGRIGRWVQLSSVGAYGPQRDGIVTETTKSNPIGVYETTKVESDELVKQAGAKGSFENVILRPSNVFGIEMTNQSLYGLMNAIQRKRFFFTGKAGAFANYIHVDNVVAALGIVW
jgi:nucleoside-diphosphate-sugar epimerase